MAAYRRKGKICDCTLGAIYLARDEVNDRDVALKQLSFPRDQDMHHLRAFVARIDDARKLQHDNIITTYGIIHEAFDVSIAMELMRCKTLQQKLNAGASFSVNAVLSIGIQLASALQYAHDSGIYHGSVNAHHVYLRKDGVVKLSNFGFNYSVEGVPIGPPTSRAPEQWQGEPLNRLSDVYGLGILLYQLLSGRFPYRASNTQQLRERVMSLPPLPLESLAPKVPFKLHQVVMQAIEKQPEHRFQTMKEMELALREVAQEPGMSSRTDAFLIHELNHQPFMANDIDFSRSHWPLQVLNSWPTRHIKQRSRDDMIDWLLDPAQHSEPFTGVAILDLNYMLMCWRGFLIACIDLNTHRYGNTVLQSLPEYVEEMTVFTPVNLHLRPFALLLATILRDPEPLYDQLHSDRFVAAEFIRKLEHDKFTGVLKFSFGEHIAWAGYETGVFIFLLKNDYSATPCEKNAPFDPERACNGLPFTVDVYATSFTPLQAGLARYLKDLLLHVSFAGARQHMPELLKLKPRQLRNIQATELREHCQLTTEPGVLADELRFGDRTIRERDILALDHNIGFCRWMLCDLYVHLLAEGYKDALTYLVSWLPEVSYIRLHHALADDEGHHHVFDIVTFDVHDKVLHVVRNGMADIEAFDRFVSAVTAVKQHYMDQGDLGAAIYRIHQPVDDDLRDYWQAQVSINSGKSLLKMGRFDVFSGLKSFVRLASNRGFHLLLAESADDGHRLVGY